MESKTRKALLDKLANCAIWLAVAAVLILVAVYFHLNTVAGF